MQKTAIAEINRVMDKEHLIKKALWLEYVTAGWNIVEGIIAVAGGITAGSIALIGFGLDSFIEVTAAGALIWRLKKNEPEEESAAEKKALRIVAVTFFLLAIYVGIESGKALLFREAPKKSLIGIALTAVSVVVMPFLAFAKRGVAKELKSRALAADSAETLICSMLSAVVLIGLALNTLLGWWWADPVAGLVMVGFLVKEGREAWEGAHCC